MLNLKQFLKRIKKSNLKIGQKVGALTILKELSTDERRNTKFYRSRTVLAECECGERVLKKIYLLENRDAKVKASCGCISKKERSKRMTVHGHSKNGVSSTYKAWNSIKQRCIDENSHGYKYNGAKGIKICKKWMKFENFLKEMGERPKESVLFRIDRKKGFNKENCKWVNKKEASLTNHYGMITTAKGLKAIRLQRKTNLSKKAILQRMRSGWSEEEILNVPQNKSRKSFRKKEYPTIEIAIKKISKKHSPRNETIKELYKKGFSYQDIGEHYNITRQRIQQIIKYGK